jgi:hypothetical protein
MTKYTKMFRAGIMAAGPRDRAQAARTPATVPMAASASAVSEGNRSPSAFGNARIRRPQSRDSAGDVQ